MKKQKCPKCGAMLCAPAELKKLQNTYNGMRARHSLELSVIEAFLFDDHDEDGDLNGLPNQWYDYETMVSSKAQMVVIERNQLKAELMECARAIEIKDRDGMAAYNRANKAESELAAEKAKNIYLLTAMADDAEKHEAELAEAINQRDKAHSSMIAYEAAAHRTAYAEAKLAKREKALEQAVRHISCFCAPMAEEHTATALAYDLIRRCADESPELAEWLKQRGEK